MNQTSDPRKKPSKKIRRTLSLLGRPVETFRISSEADDVRKPARVSGPYYDANVNAYRIVVFDGDKRKTIRYSTLQEAEEAKREVLSSLRESEVTLHTVLDEFLAEKRRGGLRPVSIKTLDYKLRYFLPNRLLTEFTPAFAQKLYNDEIERITRFDRVTRAQTHRMILRMAKMFFRWVVERGYLRTSPFEKVKAVGKSHVGKLQLRIDEARKLTQILVQAGQAGEEGAIAAFCQLVLGLRTSEVLGRQVRDLDDNGYVLWIPSGKNDNARRRLQVPEALRRLLLLLTAGQPPERLIFGGQRTRPHFQAWLWKHVKKYCQQAQLPRVCPHSLRGLHSSLAVSAGCTSAAVSAALGHGSFAITAKHYVDGDALLNSSVRRVTDMLAGQVRDSDDDRTGLIERLRAMSPEQRREIMQGLDGRSAP